MLNCKKCNSLVDENTQKFCPICGEPVVLQAPVQNVGYGANPNPNPYGQYDGAYQPGPVALPMRWFSFLIYFSMFAGAFISVINAIMMFSGGHYQGQAALVYYTFPGIKTVDMLCGVLYLGLAVLYVVTRFSLAGYKSNGPKLLYASYVVSTIIEIVYAVLVAGATSGEVNVIGSSIPSIISTAVVLCLNVVYFKKRAHLFCN